jgi:hypothetical protein
MDCRAGWVGGLSSQRLLPKSTMCNAYVGVIRFNIILTQFFRSTEQQFSLVNFSFCICPSMTNLRNMCARHAPATTTGLKELWDDSESSAVPLVSQLQMSRKVSHAFLLSKY